ncbi:hypothetical protein HGI47_09615 [Novosphingobium sp. ERN07]|uniref:hypothetical protein n=1 Tax=Novosphingobium sp. ERN07 TaxID=2726187 RepID=UPI0014575952|nr:hypothetical protein [Novosphingobium sp. ERN07]NLR71130.1 hypothetical protein [Novosphingobium sp. ERN07]
MNNVQDNAANGAGAPDRLSKAQTDLYRTRQRGRNKVLGIVLGSLAILFFAISIVKIAAQTGGAH